MSRNKRRLANHNKARCLSFPEEVCADCGASVRDQQTGEPLPTSIMPSIEWLKYRQDLVMLCPQHNSPKAFPNFYETEESLHTTIPEKMLHLSICGHKSGDGAESAETEGEPTVMFYSREDYNLFKITRKEDASDEDTLQAVKTLLDDEKDKIRANKKPKIHKEARCRALYIAVARAHFKTFEYILEDMGVKYPQRWRTWPIPSTSHLNPTEQDTINGAPAGEKVPKSGNTWPILSRSLKTTERAANTDAHASEKAPQNRGTWPILSTSHSNTTERAEKAVNVLRAIVYLREVPTRLTENDIYFPDRDGQCLMHYIAKDGFTDVFEYLVEEKDLNPLRRDRLGRTAWDLAYARATPDRIGILGLPANEENRKKVSPELIRKYVLKAPVQFTADSAEPRKMICINQLQKAIDPTTDKHRFFPKEFLKGASLSQLMDGSNAGSGNSTNETGVVWIQLDENNDALFTPIIHKVCEWKGYTVEEIPRIFKFHGDTFLEQEQGEPHFKFRQPLYQTFQLRDDIEISSVVMPFFDSGDPKGGERGAHLDEKNLDRTSWMNVHVQRTLDESYYLGLNKLQLERRNYNKILNDEKFSPKSDNILLVSQLWLWKIENVIITAFPREREYKSSNLFDHTLSLLRDIGSDARRGLSSDQFAAWIVSECIHRLDYPCMADLEEPIPYFLGKVVAVTLQEIEQYVSKDKGRGLYKNDIEKERLCVEQITAVRSKIMMIKNIVSRQEEVWKTFSKRLSTRLWRGNANRDTLDKVKDLTLRPKDDFQKLKRKIQRIEQDSERAEAVILVQLDLKGKHASLREAHNSLLLSMAVIGFTIITIIFAPLSFLTSLLALPIDDFQNQHNSTKTFTSKYIAHWLGAGEGVTWALTGVCVLGALRLIHWMENMPSQFLGPALAKVLKTILSPFRSKVTKAASDTEAQGAKWNRHASRFGVANGSAGAPTPQPDTPSKPPHWWFGKKENISSNTKV